MSRLPVFPASADCAPCGKCCTSVPGTTSPEDWGAPDLDAMRARLSVAFASGRWTLDLWYGEPHDKIEALRGLVYIVRPARKGYEGAALDELEFEDDDADAITRYVRRMTPPSFPCTFHGPTGCALAADARPVECRALEPMPGGKGCKPHAGAKRDRALEWLPFQAILPRP